MIHLAPFHFFFILILWVKNLTFEYVLTLGWEPFIDVVGWKDTSSMSNLLCWVNLAVYISEGHSFGNCSLQQLFGSWVLGYLVQVKWKEREWEQVFSSLYWHISILKSTVIILYLKSNLNVCRTKLSLIMILSYKSKCKCWEVEDNPWKIVITGANMDVSELPFTFLSLFLFVSKLSRLFQLLFFIGSPITIIPLQAECLLIKQFSYMHQSFYTLACQYNCC